MVIDWILLAAWLLFFVALIQFARILILTRLRLIKDNATLQANYLGVIVLVLMAIAIKALFHQ